jgi:hypothetical protein
MSSLCAFSTSDDKYVGQAVAALLSIRKWNESVPLFLIAKKFSRKSKKFLANHDITAIEINLSKTFYKEWEYPAECYYLFAGPHLFYKRDFSHSLYIDGDVYCNNDPLIDLNKVKHFAGVTNGASNKILGKDFAIVAKHWAKPKKVRDRIQSGVLYFNNINLEKIDLLGEIGKLFHEADRLGIPRKGDDSLFTLFQYVYPQLSYLNLARIYNYIENEQKPIVKKTWLTRNESLTQECIFYHFTSRSPKPWIDANQYPDYACKYFSEKWRHRLIDNFSTKELKRYFPNIDKQLRHQHLRFYWYPGKNVGDLVTPYFLSKVCGVSRLQDYALSEKDIGTIEANTINNRRQHELLKKSVASEQKAEYCVSTGSVIRLCQKKALVFGSGIRSKGQEVKPSFVRSVRGPLTRARFIAEGYECPLVYGDPGLLLPRFYRPQKIRQTYSLGILPHFTEYEEVQKLYRNVSDVIVINMGCGDLEKVIDQICSCKATVSSSLHGLVFSHAYKIPTRRIVFSDKVYGDGTKYNDYYLGINLKALKPIDAKDKKIGVLQFQQKAIETLDNFDDTRLFDAIFFDEHGFRNSAYLPY